MKTMNKILSKETKHAKAIYDRLFKKRSKCLEQHKKMVIVLDDLEIELRKSQIDYITLWQQEVQHNREQDANTLT